MKRLFSGLIALSLLPATAADAHIQLDFPQQRYADQKTGPCGRANDTGRGQNVTVFRPGETITVMWRETINHPGHFRISFDDDGQDGFADPAAYDDFYTVPSVIADDIPDINGGMTSLEITLPNIECDNCTLQVTQIMYDKPPYGDGNDLYYQCADLTLSGTTPDAGPTPDAAPTPDAGGQPGPDGGMDPGDPDEGCCQSGVDSLPGSGVLLILVLGVLPLVMRRRRNA